MGRRTQPEGASLTQHLSLALALFGCALPGLSHAESLVAAWGKNTTYTLYGPNWLTGPKAISAGLDGNAVVTAAGGVVTWAQTSRSGQNIYYTGISNAVAVAGGVAFGLALHENGTVTAWGPSDPVASSLSNVVAIALGPSHRLALRADGTVVAWGNNASGQAEVPPGLANVTAIAAGDRHSLALCADGSVIAWGNNRSGQTRIPPGLTQVKALAAGAEHNLAVDVTGRVTAWGSNTRGQASVPPGLSKVVAVAAGSAHSVALKADGTVVAWGSNAQGQTEVPSGLSHVVALSANGAATLALVGGDIPPFISYQPVGGSVPLGTNFAFLCLAQGSPRLSYQWQHNGTNIPSSGTAVLLGDLQPSHLGVYRVSVSNAFGAIQSAEAFLTVTDDIPLVVQAPNSFGNLPGSDLSFEVVTTNREAPSFSPAQAASFQLQTSTNLQNWTTLPNALTWSNGSLQFRDPAATHGTRHFYRIRQH